MPTKQMKQQTHSKILEFLNLVGKILALLAALTAALAYFLNKDLAALVALLVACLIGACYSIWVVVARSSPPPSLIVGDDPTPVSIPVFSRVARIVAATAAILQVAVLVVAFRQIISVSPILEKLQPAVPGESLIVVYALEGPGGQSDLALRIAARIREALENSPTTSLPAVMGDWRVERSRRRLTPDEALKAGRELGALLVVVGRQDGEIAHLDVAIAEESLVMPSAAVRGFGVGIEQTAMPLTGTIESISDDLVGLSLFVQGLHFYQRAGFAAATRAFSNAAKAFNSDLMRARAVYMRGVSWYALGDFQKARDDYKHALREGLDIPEVHWQLADLHMYAGDWSLADRELKAALELSAYSSNAYYRCGMSAFLSRRDNPYVFADNRVFFKKADDYFRLAFETDPSNIGAVVARADLHRRFGKYLDRPTEIELPRFLKQALQANPKSAELHLLFSRVQFALGKTNEAKTLLLEGMRLDASRTPEFLLGLGMLHVMTGDSTTASKYLNEFLECDSNRDGIWWERAGARAQIARINGDANAKLLKQIDESEAAQRRHIVLQAIGEWEGRVWNRDFHGSRSTKDLLLFILTEARVIPRTTDRQSAQQVFGACLVELNPEQWLSGLPVWFATGLLSSGGFFGITCAEQGKYRGYYLEAKVNGKLATFDDPVENLADCQYTVFEIRMDRTIAFTGD